MRNFLPSTFDVKKANEIIPYNIPLIIVNKDNKVLYSNNEYFFNMFNVYNMYKDSEKNIHFSTILSTRILILPFNFYGLKYYLILRDKSNMNIIFQKNNINQLLYVFFLLFLVVCLIFYDYNRNFLNEIKRLTRSVNKITNKRLSYRLNKAKYDVSMYDLISTFNLTLERLEHSFARMQGFTSDVSHELKTPIASIKNMVEVELINDRTKEEYQEVLIKVLEEINWFGEIITDLTLIENMNENHLKIEKLNLQKIIYQVVELVEILAIEKNIEISVEVSDNVFIMGDSNSLKRVVMNLIINSIKYNVENGKIIISAFNENNKTMLVVEDTGIGIKKENINKIFDRFYREDKVRTTKKEGSGLGLSMVKQILDLHKALIVVNSIEGKGTKFIISFLNDEKENLLQ